MPDPASASVKYRSLLTDTLPYEVPVIFSNDRFHATLSALERGGTGLSAEAENLLNTLLTKSYKFTIPYSYVIAKDAMRSTTLGVIHPQVQKELAEFYEMHWSSILNYCSNEKFSLRRPVAVASPFSKEPIEEDSARLRIGVVSKLAEAGEPDVSHMTSYFVYGKYNLLGKFVASREFLRLEARYGFCRTLDISKCFFNIYTHSIAWAVKEKAFAKANTNAYSFELKFDHLMQRSNYNETNGIVIGPEVSRLFAEIILQDVDRRIERQMLLGEHRAVAGRDYDVRRYVDDYYVFGNSMEIVNRCESSIRMLLAEYKLHLNEGKLVTLSRPFVSNLTLARQKVDEIFTDINQRITELEESENNPKNVRIVNHVRRLTQSLRTVVAEYEIEFANISGWIVARLRGACRRCVNLLAEPLSVEVKKLIGDIAIAIFETVFYIAALDTRVRTTYSLCQMALLMHEKRSAMSEVQRDTVEHIITDESANILRSMVSRTTAASDAREAVEVYNFLICGAMFVGPSFVGAGRIRELLKSLHELTPLRYFRFATLRFCYLKDVGAFGKELDDLHAKAVQHLKQPHVRIERDAEEYLMLCDILSAADRPVKERREVLVHCLKANPSNAAVDALVPYAGFSDWDGLSVEHLLRRKELRPVYAWG